MDMILLFILSSLLYVTQSDDCGCEISVISASPTYDLGQSFSGFTSVSADPLAPWDGTSTHFKGTSQGGSTTVYEYGIQCATPCWIKNVNIQGAAWRESHVTLLNDATSGTLGSADFNDGNVFKSNNLDMSSNEQYLTQFRLKETNTDTNWRYRSLISMTQVKPSELLCPKTQCSCNCNCNCQFSSSTSGAPAAVTNEEMTDSDDYAANSTECNKSNTHSQIALWCVTIGLLFVIIILQLVRYKRPIDKTDVQSQQDEERLTLTTTETRTA
eukprot:10584_1